MASSMQGTEKGPAACIISSVERCWTTPPRIFSSPAMSRLCSPLLSAEITRNTSYYSNQNKFAILLPPAFEYFNLFFFS